MGSGGAGVLCTGPALVASVVAGVGLEAREGRGGAGGAGTWRWRWGTWEASTGGEARNQLSGWMSSRIGHLAATCYTWFDGSPPAAPVPEKTHSQRPAEWTAAHPSPVEQGGGGSVAPGAG